MRFTPFEIDLDQDLQDQTEKNLARLAATPTPAGETFSFGFLSDTHDGYDFAGTIMGNFEKREEVKLVVHSGDFTDFGAQQEFKWFHDETANRRTPILVVTGNHDGLANGRELYAKMFGPTNFTFRYGSVKFVFFNSNTIEYKLAHPELEWLEKEVNDKGPDEGVIVVTHHPADSKPHFSDEDTARYKQIQRDAGVLANLHGHVHEEFVVEQDGPVTYLRAKAALSGAYAVVTTNGKSLSWERCTVDACEPVEVLVP